MSQSDKKKRMNWSHQNKKKFKSLKKKTEYLMHTHGKMVIRAFLLFMCVLIFLMCHVFKWEKKWINSIWATFYWIIFYWYRKHKTFYSNFRIITMDNGMIQKKKKVLYTHILLIRPATLECYFLLMQLRS